MPLLQYVRLIDIMARMSLRADATRFYLGYIWWLIEPVLYVAVFFLVFSVILGWRQADFLIFLATGKLAYLWFSKSVTQASGSIIAGKGLVGKINVPKTLFPLSVVQEGLYKQVAVFAMLAIVLLLNGYAVTATWLYFVPVVLVNYIMIVACAFVGAFLVTVVRDFQQIIPLGMLFLMFTSGVFWNPRDIGDPVKTDLLLTFNPMAFILDAYRQALMYNTPPDMLHLLCVGLGFAALAALMMLLMRRGSQYLALKAITA